MSDFTNPLPAVLGSLLGDAYTTSTAISDCATPGTWGHICFSSDVKGQSGHGVFMVSPSHTKARMAQSILSYQSYLSCVTVPQ